MGAIWLILSGAYIEQELVAEFGQLPPAFLPVGTQRLYELQLARLPKGNVHLTLPEDFTVPANDAARLGELGVNVIGTPEGLSLGQAVMWSLNYIGATQTAVHILHGDTVVDLPALGDTDVVAAAELGDGYSWAEIEAIDGRILSLTTVSGGAAGERRRPVACGYFAFQNSLSLVRCITRAGGDFIAGINRYCQEHRLTTVNATNWLDFGHVQTFFRSRRSVTTARVFNTLLIDARVVRKSSRDASKIHAEAAWFAAAPAAIQPYCARLIDCGEGQDGRPYYDTEYEYAPTLSELFVYGANGRAAWSAIIASCEEFLQACADHRGPGGEGSGDRALQALTAVKTAARLEQFARQTGFDISGPTKLNGRALPGLVQVAEALTHCIDTRSGRVESVMHGDFCFSNILFNSRTRRIRTIDPRGYAYPGQPSIYGDSRYDLAKLAHSVLGRYDDIIAGRYRVERIGLDYTLTFETAFHHAWLEATFGGLVINGSYAGGREVCAIMIDLFLSMLPLHVDRPERQQGFIANALRLYSELESASS